MLVVKKWHTRPLKVQFTQKRKKNVYSNNFNDIIPSVKYRLRWAWRSERDRLFTGITNRMLMYIFPTSLYHKTPHSCCHGKSAIKWGGPPPSTTPNIHVEQCLSCHKVFMTLPTYYIFVTSYVLMLFTGKCMSHVYKSSKVSTHFLPLGSTHIACRSNAYIRTIVHHIWKILIYFFIYLASFKTTSCLKH